MVVFRRKKGVEKRVKRSSNINLCHFLIALHLRFFLSSSFFCVFLFWAFFSFLFSSPSFHSSSLKIIFVHRVKKNISGNHELTGDEDESKDRSDEHCFLWLNGLEDNTTEKHKEHKKLSSWCYKWRPSTHYSYTIYVDTKKFLQTVRDCYWEKEKDYLWNTKGKSFALFLASFNNLSSVFNKHIYYNQHEFYSVTHYTAKKRKMNLTGTKHKKFLKIKLHNVG